MHRAVHCRLSFVDGISLAAITIPSIRVAIRCVELSRLAQTAGVSRCLCTCRRGCSNLTPAYTNSLFGIDATAQPTGDRQARLRTKWRDDAHQMQRRYPKQRQHVVPGYIGFLDIAVFADERQCTAPVRSPLGCQPQYIGDPPMLAGDFVIVDWSENLRHRNAWLVHRRKRFPGRRRRFEPFRETARCSGSEKCH